MAYCGRGWTVLGSDGERWIEMDSDGYIITHNVLETTQEYYGQRWI